MNEKPHPTQRELEILKIVWDRGEATVRDVYEEMRRQAPIAQNTVQAFLRIMENKGFVTHRVEGRTYVYRPVDGPDQTQTRLVGRLLDGLFDGAMDQLVDRLLSHRRPTTDELQRLEKLLQEHRQRANSSTDEPPE